MDDREEDPAVMLARKVSSVLSAADIDNKVVFVSDVDVEENTKLLPSTSSVGYEPEHHYVQVGTYNLHAESILTSLEMFDVKQVTEEHTHPALGVVQVLYHVSEAAPVSQEDIRVVDLCGVSSFCGLIVSSETGVVYTNQVGGTACIHPELEGFLVLLDYLDLDDAYRLVGDAWHSGSNVSCLSGEGFRELSRLVEGCRVCYESIELKIDTDSINDNKTKWGEAWIPVTSVYGKGFLTWENSD